jgi:hypothetical protein
MSSTNFQQTLPGPTRCQMCGNMRPTKSVTLRRNVGMLFARRTYKIQGDRCRSCIHKAYWDFAGKNLLLGPWGTISLVVTPIYLLANTGTYVAALYKLRDAIE